MSKKQGVTTMKKEQRYDFQKQLLCIHEADIRFQVRVRDIYRRQCEIDPKFIRIDCSDENGNMLSPDAIFAKISAEVDKVIG